jgi:Ca2+-binding RTX toxin-like protein
MADFSQTTIIEKLECRRLLSSAVLVGSQLIVTGNAKTYNTIVVEYNDANMDDIIVRYDGKLKHFVTGNVGSLDLIGGEKGNSIIINNGHVPVNIRATLIGGRGTDTLVGGDGPDLFVAGSGFVTMVGGYTDDTFVAGGGNDSIYGGSGTDLIFGSTGNDYIDGGGNSDLIFAGSGNDDILGSVTGYNQIVCSGGNDNIKAHDGDTIYGGSGHDTIRGGVGSDGQLNSGTYSALAKIISIITPQVNRFKDAAGRPADEAPLT